MTKLEKVLYTAKSHVTGGRDGAAKTDDEFERSKRRILA